MDRIFKFKLFVITLAFIISFNSLAERVYRHPTLWWNKIIYLPPWNTVLSTENPPPANPLELSELNQVWCGDKSFVWRTFFYVTNVGTIPQDVTVTLKSNGSLLPVAIPSANREYLAGSIHKGILSVLNDSGATPLIDFTDNKSWSVSKTLDPGKSKIFDFKVAYYGPSCPGTNHPHAAFAGPSGDTQFSGSFDLEIRVAQDAGGITLNGDSYMEIPSGVHLGVAASALYGQGTNGSQRFTAFGGGSF